MSAGINLEMAVGLTDRVELGVRTGLRFGDGPDRALEPDNYGRLFDRQYFDGGNDVRRQPGAARALAPSLRGPVAELGLEGGSSSRRDRHRAGLEPGVPIALHLGDSVRLDTGVWMPILFAEPAARHLVPLDIWIQVSPRVWLGPMTGLPGGRIGDRATETLVSMGFGLGYQIARISTSRRCSSSPR